MSKKKLLNEAQVRRFMGLAGMRPAVVSNTIKEMYNMGEEEEDMADAEGPMADMEPEMDAEEPMADEEPAMDMPEDEAEEEAMEDVAASVIDAVAKVFREQGVEIDIDGGDEMEADMEEPAMDEPAEEPEMKMDAEEPAEDEDEVLENVSLELTEEEIVQEVARRVAARIIKAQKAEKAMNEALGRKK